MQLKYAIGLILTLRTVIKLGSFTMPQFRCDIKSINPPPNAINIKCEAGTQSWYSEGKSHEGGPCQGDTLGRIWWFFDCLGDNYLQSATINSAKVLVPVAVAFTDMNWTVKAFTVLIANIIELKEDGSLAASSLDLLILIAVMVALILVEGGILNIGGGRVAVGRRDNKGRFAK